jgi:hypothetical protein
MRHTPAFALFLAAGSLAISGSARADQPCNPIVDGTYCATQMPRYSGSSGSSTGLRPIDDMSQLVPTSAVGGNQPATLIGISFQGGSRCFGLLRRSACD